MQAAGVVVVVSENSDTPPPTRESHAAALAPLLDQPDQLRDAWAEVMERTDGRPTAAAVRETVAARVSRPVPARRRPRDDGPAHFLPDVVADDALENVRTQAVHWFEQARRVKGLLDEGLCPRPKTVQDKVSIGREADLTIRVAAQLKEALRSVVPGGPGVSHPAFPADDDGDFDASIGVASEYLASWRSSDFWFDHIGVKEARRRLKMLDELHAVTNAARADLIGRGTESQSQGFRSSKAAEKARDREERFKAGFATVEDALGFEDPAVNGTAWRRPPEVMVARSVELISERAKELISGGVENLLELPADLSPAYVDGLMRMLDEAQRRLKVFRKDMAERAKALDDAGGSD